MLKGRDLFEDVDRAGESGAFWWLGQHTFIVKLGDAVTADLAGVSVHAVRTDHEFFDQTDEGVYPFLGYVIEGGGRTIYQAGDTSGGARAGRRFDRSESSRHVRLQRRGSRASSWTTCPQNTPTGRYGSVRAPRR